jgi:amino acid transporter
MALSALLVVVLFLAGVSSVTVTSRIAFAMVRDGAIPFSTFLRPVNQFTSMILLLFLTKEREKGRGETSFFVIRF